MTKLKGVNVQSSKTDGILLDPFRVKPFADQPRKRFRGIAQLAESIRLVGQVTPIIVTAIDESGFDAELVDGERRLQACRLAKLKIKAVFRDGVNGAERFALAVAANFCRQEHDCVEIAEAIERLTASGRTHEEVSGIFGKSYCWVTQHLSLLKLHDGVKELLKHSGDGDRKQRRGGGRMTFSIALLLTGLEPALQLSLGKRIVKGQVSLAGAKEMIYREARKAGAKVGSDKPGNRVSPKAMLQQLWNVIDAARHRIEPIIALPYAQLAVVLAVANDRERETLMEQISDLIVGLEGITKTLRKESKHEQRKTA